MNWSVLLTSVVLIGSTWNSMYEENTITGGGYFSVTRSDLTAEGEAIVSALEALYGAEATLVTFLDT